MKLCTEDPRRCKIKDSSGTQCCVDGTVFWYYRSAVGFHVLGFCEEHVVGMYHISDDHPEVSRGSYEEAMAAFILWQ